MKSQSGLKTLLIFVAAIGLTMNVRADETSAPGHAPGAIVGIVRNPDKIPVSGATVTAVRSDGGAIRATLSGSDGIYSFADLPPGTWSLTLQLDGYPEVQVPALQVVTSKATRHDVVMSVPSAAAPSIAASPGIATAAPPAAVASVTVPEALQAPDAGPEVDTKTPWAQVGYVGWMNGTSREKAPVFDTKFFTPEIRLDVNYLQSLNHPQDHTIVGSTEEFRSGEFQIEQVSFGGDFHWDNVRARFLSMFGMFATTTPRNDASSSVGQWDLDNAYRYFSEANAGYHFDVNHGLNVDAGVFVSYIGLFSYYNYDNWTYQPSFVSSNTPWFFNGLRVQWWPTQNLKIEPWLINGWQSYAKFNRRPGFGGQILWIPNDSLKLVFNSYSIGQDNLNCQTQQRQSGNRRYVVPAAKRRQSERRGRILGGRRAADQLFASEAHSRRRQHLGEVLRCARPGRRRRVEDGVQLYRRHRLPVRRRHQLYARAEQRQLLRHDALRPYLVPQRSVRGDDRRRLHEQSGPLPGPDAPDQWSDGGQRVALFHATAGTEAVPMGYAAQSAVHAQGLDYLVDRSDVSALERTVLVGLGRRDASGRQQRFAGELRRRRGGSDYRITAVRMTGFRICARARLSSAPASWSNFNG